MSEKVKSLIDTLQEKEAVMITREDLFQCFYIRKARINEDGVWGSAQRRFRPRASAHLNFQEERRQSQFC